MCLWGACGDAVTPSVTSSGSTTPPSCLWQSTVSRGRDRAAPLPTHLLRICAGALKWHEQCAISKFASGQSPTSSRQGVVVCGALRLPHDLICLPLLFPQNSLRDFCGNPERQESAFSPLKEGDKGMNAALASKNNFREEGSPPLRDPICLLLKAYCA